MNIFPFFTTKVNTDQPVMPVTIAHGDGIGREIMKATLQILNAAKATLHTDEITIGNDIYLQSVKAGMKANHRGMQLIAPITYTDITNLLQRLTTAGLNFIKLENLYEMNGERAYSLGQGE